MSVLRALSLSRYLALVICIAVFLGTIGSALMGQYRFLFWPVTVAAGLLALVGIWDLIQTRHAIRRNYPILAHILSFTVSAYVEPGVGAGAHAVQPEDRLQFERHGYFVADRLDSRPGKPVFNRIVTLKDAWQSMKKN